MSVPGLRCVPCAALFPAVLIFLASCGGPEPEAERRMRETSFVQAGDTAAEADAAWAAGGRAEAAALYEEAIALRPSVSAEAYRRIAEVREAEGSPDAAVDWLERGLDRFPGDVALLKRLGALHEGQGRTAAALECYEAILKRHPDDPWAWGAVERMRKAVRRSP